MKYLPEKPTKRTVAIPAGHGFKTRPLEFYHPQEVDAYLAHLEQRAEAAEATARDLQQKYDNRTPTAWAYNQACTALEKHRTRADEAEAKLAELEKQDPAEYQYYYHNHGTGAGQWLPVTSKQAFESIKAKHSGDNDFSFRELFTRPAPAVSLADLVPVDFPAIRLKKATLWIERILIDKPGMKEAQTVSAILRNIEEATKK